MRSARGTTRSIALLALALAAPARAGAPPPTGISGIAAGEDREGSAVWTADGHTGGLYYWYVRPSRQTPQPVHLDQLRPYTTFDQPQAIAYHDGKLYVCDAGEPAIHVVDVDGVTQRVFWRGAPLLWPVSISVADGGIVAVADAGLEAVILFRGDNPPSVLSDAPPEAPRQVVLSSNWLYVLDGKSGTVFTLAIRGDPTQAAVTHERAEPLPSRVSSAVGQIHAVAAHNGVLYLAGSEGLFVYTPEDESPLEAYEGLLAGRRVHSLAASRESLFVTTEGDEGFLRLDRPVPVELRLEARAQETNRSLATIYRYLYEHDLLSTRQLTLADPYDRLEDVLLEQKILLGGETVETAFDKVPSFFKRLSRRVRGARVDPAKQDRADLSDLLCDLNPDLCRDRSPAGASALEASVDAGARINLPAVRLDSVIRRSEQDLQRNTVLERIRQLVPSTELREQVLDASYILRLNPGLQRAKPELEQDPAAVFGLHGLAMTLPMENWSASFLAPAPDLYDPRSALLRTVDESPSMQLVPKEILPAAARSAAIRLQPGDPTGPTEPAAAADDCDAVRTAWQELKRDISYPPGFPPSDTPTMTIGVIEKQESIDAHHHAFASRSDPTWYQLGSRSEFHPEPDPQTFAQRASTVVFDSLSSFRVDRHHGSHVASIIATRAGCGAGLLPTSRLFLVDANRFAARATTINDAANAGVKVVNISQSFGPDGSEWAPQKNVLAGLSDVLFVVAAGNDGIDLNGTPADVPVSWADEANFLVVTAADSNGHVVAPHVDENGVRSEGANYGKQYVHLAAPGESIIGATEGNRYARVGGTSQAAPQVTSAAAYLLKRGCRPAATAKARLIAAARWENHLKQAVWGGLFDFGAAVSFSDKFVLSTRTRGDEVFVVDVRNDPVVNIRNDVWLHTPDDGGDRILFTERSLNFRDILSLQAIGPEDDLKYRVVFQDNEQLKILLDAELDSEQPLKCRNARRWDPQTGALEPAEVCGDSGIGITQITRYLKPCDDYNVKRFGG